MTKVDTDNLKKEEAAAQEEIKEDKADKTEEAAEKSCDEQQQGGGDGEKSDEKPQEEKKEPEEDSDTRYMRLMADFQNYKKRVEKEKKDLYSYANEQLITELLEILDNFERALEQETGEEGFKEGMNMIFKQLTGVLEKSGLAEIPALGEEFDPNFHNAVMTEESDEYESGKVSGVMQKGYTLNGKVIRPSMVKVAG